MSAFLTKVELRRLTNKDTKKNMVPKKPLIPPAGISSQSVRQKPQYLENGCSKHMTGDKMCFLSFEKRIGVSVTFRNNDKTHIKDKCMISKPNSAKIEDVQYVIC